MRRVHRDLGFERGNLKINRLSECGPVNVECTALAIQQSPSFLPIEEDSSETCPRYPLVDMEQDENLALSKVPPLSPLQHGRRRKPCIHGIRKAFPRVDIIQEDGEKVNKVVGFCCRE